MMPEIFKGGVVMSDIPVLALADSAQLVPLGHHPAGCQSSEELPDHR